MKRTPRSLTKSLLIAIAIAITLSPTLSSAGNTEKYNTGWQLTLDNNVLSRYMKDRDYTAGIAFTASGSRAQNGWLNIDGARAWLFDFLLSGKHSLSRSHAVQYGAIAFTPDDITASQPVLDDRPFASLFYISNTELNVYPEQKKAIRSSLSVGLLGLGLAGDIQRFLHKSTGSDEANGWGNQISSGGEPTLMATLSRQDIQFATTNQQLSSHLEANLGYSTDINAGINWRLGKLDSPWWSFNPSHIEYMASAASSDASYNRQSSEFYLFASANIKYRAYSAMLQGQFRHSAHRLSFSQIEQLLGSITIGVAGSIVDNYHLSFSVHGSSPEIKGSNARSLWWASLTLQRRW